MKLKEGRLNTKTQYTGIAGDGLPTVLPVVRSMMSITKKLPSQVYQEKTPHLTITGAMILVSRYYVLRIASHVSRISYHVLRVALFSSKDLPKRCQLIKLSFEFGQSIVVTCTQSAKIS